MSPPNLKKKRPETLDRFVSDNGLLDRGEGLEGREEAVDVLLAAHQGREHSELLGQGQQHLVLKRHTGSESDQILFIERYLFFYT